MKTKNIIKYLILAIFILLIIIVFQQFYSKNYYLPFKKWGEGEFYNDSIGTDAYYCRRLSLNQRQYQKAIEIIGLETIDSLPTREKHQVVQCEADWWNISFPSDAEFYTVRSNGNIRILAAWRNGFFYFTYEIR